MYTPNLCVFEVNDPKHTAHSSLYYDRYLLLILEKMDSE